MMGNSLLNIQEWMHNIITNRGEIRAKLMKEEAENGTSIFDVISYKRNIPLLSRLQVYTTGFEIRLIECLRLDYPLLRKFMTDTVFDHFARAYLHFHKPSSYTLFDLGSNFPAFLLASKPQNLSEEDQDRIDFPYALACYERAFLESTRAKGSENENSEELPNTTNDDFSFFDMPIIKLISCVRCLELNFPILSFVDDLKKGDEIPRIPKRQKSFLAITRQSYRMKIIKLEAWQYHLLIAAHAPISASLAARKSAEILGGNSGEIIADTMFFIPQAIQDGILIKVNDI